ncbi:MAG: alpha/beta hydrolase, partial [Gammaproteobacteria bacterium]
EDGRARHFTNARVEVIEKAGHWLHHDQFDRFMELVTRFLR